jgi:hypothetical protein
MGKKTVAVDSDTHARLKRYHVACGVTIERLTEFALREYLDRRERENNPTRGDGVGNEVVS